MWWILHDVWAGCSLIAHLWRDLAARNHFTAPSEASFLTACILLQAVIVLACRADDPSTAPDPWGGATLPKSLEEKEPRWSPNAPYRGPHACLIGDGTRTESGNEDREPGGGGLGKRLSKHPVAQAATPMSCHPSIK